MNEEERKAARIKRLSKPADWSGEPMVDDDQKLHLPRDVLRAIDGPLSMAFDQIGKAMNPQAAYEDCTPDQIRCRAAWHALHYVQRRLSGWDSLPDDFFWDGIAWERQQEAFDKDAKERE